MKTRVCTARFTAPFAAPFAVLFMALASSPVQADPMADICRARAEKGSGQTGAQTGLTRQAGNTRFRLSGSVAIGASRSSGPPSPNAPAFAGQAASERHEEQTAVKRRSDNAASKYTRIYDDCMRAR